MQTRVTKVDFNKDTGVTEITLSTPYGVFTGYAKYNKDKEKFSPSMFMGTELAEARANIAAINEAIKRKRMQKKGVERLLYSCGGNKQVYKYANKIIKSIKDEIKDFNSEKEFYLAKIKSAFEARELFIRTQTVDKATKEKYLKEIREGIKQLGQVNSIESE